MSFALELREQGRGMAGAVLVLGISFAYTIETWWLAVEVPATQLVVFVLAGLALVVPITRSVGFRQGADGEQPPEGDRSDSGDETESGVRDRGRDDAERAESERGSEDADGATTGSVGGGRTAARVDPDPSPAWVEAAEAVFQAFFVGYLMLFLLGIIDLGDPVSVIVRTGLVQVVPLAFGAALANEILSGEQDEIPEAAFPKSLGVFAMGAVFFAAPIAPTEEVPILAARAGWPRIAALVVATLVATYLVLYVLEFRGQTDRLQGRSLWRRIGQTCMLYAVGLTVAAGLLVAVGETGSELLTTGLRRTIVLGFPAAIGASAARVVLA